MTNFLPNKISTNKMQLISKTNQISLFVYIPMEIGEMIALIHNTRKTLNILEPITLPIAISVFCFITATTEVASSGNDVHNATMDNHIAD